MPSSDARTALFVVTLTAGTSPSSIASCRMLRTVAGYVAVPAGDLPSLGRTWGALTGPGMG
jgi:hypothetical protein